MTNGDLVATARDLAETNLFPSANRTDVEGRLPRSSLDAIAAGGFYGLMGPKSLGGLEADPTTAGLVIEAFAGGCLTSAFIWAQHHVAVRLMSAASSAIAELWGPKLCAGDIRAGVAFAHLRREGPSPIVAVPEPNHGWRVTGVANWMTGWGAVQVINIAAIHNEQVVWFLADAVEGPTLSAQPLALSAVNSSGTVSIRLTNHIVSPDRVIAIQQLSDWRTRDRLNLRQNGSYALGLAQRCATLLGDEGNPLTLAVDAARNDLDAQATAANVDGLAAARASASWLAVRAAAALTVHEAGKSMITDSHAQRLGREAMFLLVQGQTAPIREAQKRLLL